MKKLILLLLLLPLTASAQFPMVAGWQSAAVAPAFSPPDIDSIKGWYVARDLADSLGKAPGDTTYIWKNRAKWFVAGASVMGDGFQFTDSQKPVYRGDSTTLVFDGVGDHLLFNTLLLHNALLPFTIIAVLRSDLNANSEYVWDSPLRAIMGRNDNATYMQVYNGSWVSNDVKHTSDSVRIIQVVYNGASSVIRGNKLESVINPGTGGLGYGNFAIASRYNLATSHGWVSIRELIIYKKALTEPERVSIETYLATKYGVTLP